MNSTTLPSPGQKPNNTGPGLPEYENCQQPPAFSLLDIHVALIPGGHMPRMMRKVPQTCKVSQVTVWMRLSQAVLLGRVQTMKTCVTFGNEEGNGSINTVMGEIDLLLSKEKVPVSCQSAIEKYSWRAKSFTNCQTLSAMCSSVKMPTVIC